MLSEYLIWRKQKMTKSLFEQLGGTYHKENGYFLPDLRLHAEEEQSIGTWGWASASGTQAANRPSRQARQRRLDYLKQFREAAYTNLLTSVKLKAYLSDIDGQVQERFERLIESVKQAQGITEQLKTENALEWVGQLGNIRACAILTIYHGS